MLVTVLLLLTTSSPGAAQSETVHEINVSPPQALAEGEGTWRYHQLVEDLPGACSQDNAHSCVRHILLVDNDSNDTLECTAHETYDAADVYHSTERVTRRVVPPGKAVTVLTDLVDKQAKVTSAVVECTARASFPYPQIAPECSFQIKSADPLESFYPATSQRLAEEGPVVLMFTLTQAEGPASDVIVTGSSLSSRLDEAAVKYIGSVTFTTPCPGTRYPITVRFQLK